MRPQHAPFTSDRRLELRVNIAVHIRRGDNPHIEADQSYTSILVNLGSMLVELNAQWQRLHRPRCVQWQPAAH